VATPPAAPAAPSEPPLAGELSDTGVARRDRVRTLRYATHGSVRIDGDLTAGTVHLHGLTNVGGRVNADHLRLEGSLDTAGDVDIASEATLKGRTSIGGSLRVGDVTVGGRLHVAGGIAANGGARFIGVVSATGPLTARSLGFTGALEVAGHVESPYIVGKLRGRSVVGTLHGQHVRIVRAGLLPFGAATLTVDSIEASEVDLAGVRCEYLRAERIRLGPGCRITRVDGPIARQHRSARVGPAAIVDAPAGMTR